MVHLCSGTSYNTEVKVVWIFSIPIQEDVQNKIYFKKFQLFRILIVEFHDDMYLSKLIEMFTKKSNFYCI